MHALGFGGLIQGPACAVLTDGCMASAVEQKKVAGGLEAGAWALDDIESALKLAGVSAEGVGCVALVRPFAIGPEGALHLALRARFPASQLVLVEHHTAHAASTFFASPFEEATVLTLDRMGDFTCGARWHGNGNQLRLDKELYYPDSLGDLYGRVTELLGFRATSEEHKVQWLSTAGDSGVFLPLFEEILGQHEWPRLDRSFFDSDRISHGGFSAKFYRKLQLEDAAAIPQSMRATIAAGLQKAIERTVLRMADGAANICLAGGLAFNALLVNAIEQSKNVFVQPAAGNSGPAIGAVLHAWPSVDQQKQRASLQDMCLGPGFNAEDVKQVLENCKLRLKYLMTTEDLMDSVVAQINDQKIIAWMQGRMEFGPRALGNRRILASPLNAYSTENLNIYIKHREPFRKFAASVPTEFAGDDFHARPDARYLATVA